MQEKVKMFKEIVNEMADLYEKKNSNYGDSFGQLFDALGPISGLVPLHNKLDRATSLVKGDKNNFESLEDTFKDLACYAIMNLIEMKSRATCYPDADKVIKPTEVNGPNITTLPHKTTVELNPSTTAIGKDPCVGCPWNGKSFGSLYVGDTPCQWCEHGTKVTCKNINYCTSTTVDNADSIKLKATSSTGLEDVIVKADPSLVTSTMINEHYDTDGSTVKPTMYASTKDTIAVDANITKESSPVKVYKPLRKTK